MNDGLRLSAQGYERAEKGYEREFAAVSLGFDGTMRLPLPTWLGIVGPAHMRLLVGSTRLPATCNL